MRRLTAVPGKGVKLRAGWTLVELMVALMVFSVGALAMSATAANVMSMITASKNRTLAASVADSRFERMRAQGCYRHQSDSATTGAITEVWQVVPLVRADDVTVRVTFAANHRMQTRVYRSFLPCP